MIINVRTKGPAQPITMDKVLERISEYDIYRYYIGRDFKVNREMRSPLRKDDHPSFMVSNKYGYLYHVDFSFHPHRGDCFDFVQQMYSVDLPTALEMINRDFCLNLQESDRPVPAKKVVTWKQPALAEPRLANIQVCPKPFTLRELQWWGEYGITEEELKEADVYSVKRLFVNKSRYALGSTEMVFGYLFDNKYWKIYRPLEPRERKWLSSVPIERVDGIENIRPGCGKAVVTKSKKDLLVLRKVLPCVCAVQNESKVALSEETVATLKANASDIFINYDADEPGKRNSWEVTKEFGFRHVNVPDKYVGEGIKDFAELARRHGIARVAEHFKEKGII